MSAVGTRERSTQAPVAYEMPPEVVREAIVNAVLHRDYTSSGSVRVMLFSDRLEVWNPGTLPPSLTLAQLRQPHGSVPGNPLLAELLYLTQYIERMGTGTGDMIERCRTAGLRGPEFRCERTGLWVEFGFPLSGVEPTTETPVKTLVETPGKTPGKTPPRILELLQKNPNLTVPDIALQISKSESAVQRGIMKLQIAGRLKRAGSRKSGYWEVLK
jgi:ATP-dependent DNA helicase RecG